MTQRFRTSPGKRLPGGAIPGPGGVNFSLYSRYATRVWLVLYAEEREVKPLDVIELDPETNHTYHFWHVFVHDVSPGLYYTWRVEGPNDPAAGLRFDAKRELLDPWAREVSDALWDRKANRQQGLTAIRGRVVSADGYDWEGDEPLRRPIEETIIYELHVRGFTRHPSSGVSAPGTFRGLIEKIPYLVSLGITDVELLPVMAYDPQDIPPGSVARGNVNYWGYSPYAFFAPHPHYAAGREVRNEFRDMVKALHRAGIGVILDVVLNHTAEAGADGPIISFKGFGNEFFYHLEPDDRSRYRDFTGCGNTVNANHPLVARFLINCLEYWVREMHVDGFRLDLASVLSRGEDGEPMYHAPVLWGMEFSDTLARAKLIAEAWDAAGLYQVGDFPGYRWLEWNGRYRDTVRRFLRGDPGHLGDLATRITGSSDLYAHNGRRPTNSVNFVTCHDGFTVHDLVSYNRKHNEANGEGNRDGSNHNFSWNSGIEGPTTDPQILQLRDQRARNFIAVLLLSQGLPMLLAGDERLHTQDGNNNAYCQDNELSWLDWEFDERSEAMLRFVREMIALRKRHPNLKRTRFIDPGAVGPGSIHWHGKTLNPPDWDDPEARLLRFTLAGLEEGEAALHVMINMFEDGRDLRLPEGEWRRLVDTSRPSPEDILPPDEAPLHREPTYGLKGRAVAVFEQV